MEVSAVRHQPSDLLSEPGALNRLGFLPNWICQRFLSQVRIDPGAIEHIRGLAQRGSIVYVMRYRSLVDYMLIAFTLLREGLPLPAFVSDIPSLLLHPVSEILSTLWHRLRSARALGGTLRHQDDRDRCQRLVRGGRPILVFMRSRAPRLRFFGSRRVALQRVRSGTDYMREIVHARGGGDHEVFLVPLAVLRGRGYQRKESRLATFVYSVQEAPGEMKRLLSMLWNARDTSITVGKHVELGEFIEQHRDEGEERIVRRLSRALQVFLYREEKVVWGPTLLPKQRVRQMVLQTDELSALVRQLSRESGEPESKLWKTAERYFDEMAANYQGSYFAILEFLFSRVWPRVFQGFDYRGLDKVIERIKDDPVVLVPCHRSHFDYLILSYLFHVNYLSPPHIAAGVNLSFWPLGPLFRGAGAYFIRRTFEGNPLYKTVFRNYLTFLIREGYTQEFFIEGGRSRTGKILTPKLGMLSAIVNSFVDGVRRDLYFVPVSIQYGRVAEEESYKRELIGAEKEKESLWALLKARSVLRQQRGTVYVTFADPISLGEALGQNKDRFREPGGDRNVEQEKRRFIQKLGFRILRDVNSASLAGATSVTSTVLLSSPHAAWRYADFLAAAQSLVEYLKSSAVTLTPSLERNADDFLENLNFLEKGGLVQRVSGAEAMIHLPSEKRMTLDFYKNNTIHFYLFPALVIRALRQGVPVADVNADVGWWLELLRWEFALPERSAFPAEVDKVLAYLRDHGALDDSVIDTTQPFVRTLGGLLDNFAEAYWVMARAAVSLPEAGMTVKQFTESVRKRFAASLLLGEVKRPEGNSTVTYENALNRYAEVGWLQLEGKGRSRDRQVRRGPRWSELADVERRLFTALQASARN